MTTYNIETKIPVIGFDMGGKYLLINLVIKKSIA